MSDDDRSLRQQLADVTAERDRYASLVGTAYNSDGAVRTGLDGAVMQQDIDEMRVQVQAVVNFLRDNNPFGR
jgi:hypothetical protein